MSHLPPELTIYLRLILAGLACFRLAQFISLENCPLFICVTIRRWAEKKAAERKQESIFWNSVADWASCPFCQGPYWGLLCAGLVLWPTVPGDLFLLWMGIVGLQAYLQGRVKD